MKPFDLDAALTDDDEPMAAAVAPVKREVPGTAPTAAETPAVAASAADEVGERPAVRLPVALRPVDPPEWVSSFAVDEDLPADERAQLVKFLELFTRVSATDGGCLVAGPATDPAVREAVWRRGGNVLEVEELRAQLPEPDAWDRVLQLERALARPTSAGWWQMVMLLSTWAAATLPAAISEAARLLADWPDELRTLPEAWRERPDLHALARVHGGELGDGDATHVTVLRMREAAAIEQYVDRFAQVTTLDLMGTGLPDALRRCTRVARLERVVMSEDSPGPGAPARLVSMLSAPHLQSLRGLSMTGYKVDEQDLAALAECPQPLEYLKLQHAGMSLLAAQPLARLARRKLLKSLELKYNDLGPQGARALFERVEDWRALRVLDLSANEIGDEGVRALAEASLGELRWLCLSSNDPHNRLGVGAARSLANARSLGSLHTLILTGQPIGTEGVAELLYGAGLRGLRRLNVAFVGASIADIAAPNGWAEPAALTHLNISGVEPSRQKRPDMAGATFLKDVRMLNVDSLDGGEVGALLGCPHLGSLEVLALGSVRENVERAFESLVSLAPPVSLRYLHLEGWKLTVSQAKRLAASRLGQQLSGLKLAPRDTPPAVWRVFYDAGLPLMGWAGADIHAPGEHGDTLFREDV